MQMLVSEDKAFLSEEIVNAFVYMCFQLPCFFLL
jgi:hypothetical protein